MLPLGLVLAGQSATGSFTAGSVLAGAYAGAAALTAPGAVGDSTALSCPPGSPFR
ncbi:hypothetical protein [Streptomyces sp. NPDC093991]|uniref:hypothetical protein n=1 Tax=unclassified Streptomyces TaxID=2593676 RepID=UPI0034246F55